MRAYISIDMEGMPYIVSSDHLDIKGALFREAREIATKVVNIVCEELHKEGFEEIIVADSHGSMVNIDVMKLPEYVSLIRGFPRPTSMVIGVEEADIVLFLGYHAKFGTQEATFDHTYSGAVIRKIEINGIEASEYLLNAYVAGHFERPVVLVAGDEALLEDDVKRHTPWAIRVPLKRSYSRYSARSPSMAKIESALRDGVRNAIKKYREGEMRPLKAEYPIDMRITFRNTAFADVAAYLPNSERLDGLTVRYVAKDIIESYKVLELLSLATFALRRGI